MAKRLILGVVLSLSSYAQTKPDLANQGKNPDFSLFSVTKPVAVVGSLPSSCSVGQMLWLTTASAGANLYGCTSTNTFTVMSGGGSGSGTVTSVGLSLPNSIFTVTGTPVTTSGTLTGSLSSQTANYFWAAPNGTNGAPTFRAIQAFDIPTLNQNTTGNALTATQLATTPSVCSSGYAPVGILANGNATGCASLSSGGFPWTTLGDLVYYSGSAPTRLAGPTTTGNYVLTESPSGSAVAPTWTQQYTLTSGLGASVTGTGNLQVNTSEQGRTVSATTDTLVNTDCGGNVYYTSASAVTVALPQANLGGNFLTGCRVTLTAYGAGAVTVSASTSLIGPASFSISTRVIAASSGSGNTATFHSCSFVSNASNNYDLKNCN